MDIYIVYFMLIAQVEKKVPINKIFVKDIFLDMFKRIFGAAA